MCKIFHAAIYCRLSKEDFKFLGKNNFNIIDESNSIINQRNLIHNYLKDKQDIKLEQEFEDDGFTGLNFERPGFQKMMKAVNKKEINCIVVKDLSRFGRDYIETGKYLRTIFPELGVRFIAIYDNYDSESKQSKQDFISMPLKIIINDYYSHDISTKVKAAFDIKRKNGEVTASFATYGYIKNKELKSLSIDEYASAIVKEIFKLKIEGYSQNKIADMLNNKGVLSPMEYKQYSNINFKTSFKTKEKAMWTPVAINRILTNRVYLGILEQGKVTKVNYKVKKMIKKEEREWITTNNAHEPIIDKETFETVNRLLKRDVRISPNKEKVYLFSGILRCADCKQNMIRKPETHNGKRYIYYVCSVNKKTKQCSSHRISESKLIQTVMYVLKLYILLILDRENIESKINVNFLYERKIKKLNDELNIAKDELQKAKYLKHGLYDDFKEEILTEIEYKELKSIYNGSINLLRSKVENIKSEIHNINCNDNIEYFNNFLKFKDLQILDHSLLVMLIDIIEVCEDGSLNIKFVHSDRYLNQKEI